MSDGATVLTHSPECHNRWMVPTIQHDPRRRTAERTANENSTRSDGTSARKSTRQLFIHRWLRLGMVSCGGGGGGGGGYTIAAVTVTGRPVWQPRSWRFILLRTLNALPQPACVQRKGFSPVWLCEWMRRLEGREKALWQVRQMYRSWFCW